MDCFMKGVNFALGKPTWQSSVETNGASFHAVDGYKHPNFSQDSCIQTWKEYEPW